MDADLVDVNEALRCQIVEDFFDRMNDLLNGDKLSTNRVQYISKNQQDGPRIVFYVTTNQTHMKRIDKILKKDKVREVSGWEGL